MQKLIGAPRDTLTEAQVISIIQGEASLRLETGIEVIDINLNPVFDFSNDLLSGSVTRGSFNTLHGSCTLDITKNDLNWPDVLARPYMILHSSKLAARFNLGAYYLATPSQDIESTPPVFQVTGYDILQRLSDPVGESFSVDAGANYINAIEGILTLRGFTKWVTDKSAGASVLPAAKVWPITDKETTWLLVVNDLLAAIGYAGIWSDWDGMLHLAPYVSPNLRASEWTYDSKAYTSMIYPKRTIVDDYFMTPNRWVAVRQNNAENVAPVEGNGIFTFNNYGNGKTSQLSRNRIITKTFTVDAADQNALMTTAQVTIDADMSQNRKMEVSTSPNPLHWHFDRITINDAAVGEGVQAMTTEWTLPFDGTEMTQKWTLI